MKQSFHVAIHLCILHLPFIYIDVVSFATLILYIHSGNHIIRLGFYDSDVNDLTLYIYFQLSVLVNTASKLITIMIDQILMLIALILSGLLKRIILEKLIVHRGGLVFGKLIRYGYG